MHKMLILKPECKRSLGRLKCRWEDNIKIYQEKRVGSCGLDFMWLGIGSGGGPL
jgi:hypothetical protein